MNFKIEVILRVSYCNYWHISANCGRLMSATCAYYFISYLIEAHLKKNLFIGVAISFRIEQLKEELDRSSAG